MKKIGILLSIGLILASCAPVTPGTSTSFPDPTLNPAPLPDPVTLTPTPLANPSGTTPNFEHIVLIVLENKDYQEVIGNAKMPQLNALAQQNVLLSNYFAVSHPSLPNYIALISGSTQDITNNCTDCFIQQPNLADRIESSGRTWKSYLEDLPSPCFLGNTNSHVQKRNPFIYFDSVHLDAARCERSIVPLTSLDSDLAANQLPNFSFILPNLCNSSHDCSREVADKWVGDLVARLQASPAFGENSLIIITFDEGDKQNTGSCCGLGEKAGGQVAALLISPIARQGFSDSTAYSHYSLLKMILSAWNLPDLGQSASAPVIEAPWNLDLSSTMGDSSTPPTAIPDPIKDTPTPIPGPSSPPPLTEGELAFPIRAAFYYPWFPQSWDQNGLNPFTHYRPTLGYYSLDDSTVIQHQIAAMQYGKIQAGIASWWGQGHYTDNRIPLLLQEGEKTGFRWAVYYEEESLGDPSVETLRADLEYIRSRYAQSPAFLKINERFVVFVYVDPNDGCGMADRWKQANTVGAYLVLKVFPGYRNCASQPDAWHQYAPDVSQKTVGKSSFTISPGFWMADSQEVRLARDLETWNMAIRAMLASQSNFQLISTFNEWGEGTSVESGTGWESPSGYGLYLDALHNDGQSQSSHPVPTLEAGSGITLVGAGDIANCKLTGAAATSQLLDAFPSAAFFTLGDNTYPDGKPSEFQDCFAATWGRHYARLHPAAGNHDYHTKDAAGYYEYFGTSAGVPGQGYYSYNLGNWHIIVLNSNCAEVGGCDQGSPQEEWLKNDLAANQTLCSLAYWHHPLFSSGVHGNNPEMRDFWQDLSAAGVELVLNGHDHNYERFAPQNPDGGFDPVRGIRQIVVGTGGAELRGVPKPYKPNSEIVISQTYGVIKLDLHPNSYTWTFLPVASETASDSGSGICHP